MVGRLARNALILAGCAVALVVVVGGFGLFLRFLFASQDHTLGAWQPVGTVIGAIIVIAGGAWAMFWLFGALVEIFTGPPHSDDRHPYSDPGQ